MNEIAWVVLLTARALTCYSRYGMTTKKPEPTTVMRVPRSVKGYIRRRMRARETMGDTLWRLLLEGREAKRQAQRNGERPR